MKIFPFFKNKSWKEFLEEGKVKILEKAEEIVGANPGRNGKGWCSGGNMGG